MEVRWIAEGEETESNELHNEFYGKERQLAQWRWEFVDNTFGKKPIPYAVVVDNGSIVGTQALIPIRMIDQNGVFWTAKSEETLVDPKYRGKRLFEKMYKLCFAYAEEQRFASIWGFTTATRAFTRQGFEVPGATEQLFIPYSVRSVETMAGTESGGSKLKRTALKLGCLLAQTVSAVKLAIAKPSERSEYHIYTWERPDERCAELCRKFVDQFGGTTIYRDAAYLKWRLFDNPYIKSTVKGIYRDDTLLGWVAYAIGDDGMGYLVDLLAVGAGEELAETVRRLLVAAVLGTRSMGATGIRGWHVSQHPFDQLILREALKIGFYHIRRGSPAVFYLCEAGKERDWHDNFDGHFITRIYTEGVSG